MSETVSLSILTATTAFIVIVGDVLLEACASECTSTTISSTAGSEPNYSTQSSVTIEYGVVK